MPKNETHRLRTDIIVGVVIALVVGFAVFAFQEYRLSNLKQETREELSELSRERAELRTALQAEKTADRPPAPERPLPESGTLTLAESEHPFARISDLSGIRPFEDDDTCAAVSEFADVGADPRPDALPASVETALRERLPEPVDADVFLNELSRYPHAGMRLSALCAGNRNYVILENESGGLVQALQWARPEASEAYFRTYQPVPTREGVFALYQHLMDPGDILVTGGALADGLGWRAYRLDQETASADLLEACAYFPLTAEGEEPVTVDYRCDRRYRNPVKQEE